MLYLKFYEFILQSRLMLKAAPALLAPSFLLKILSKK